MGSVKPMDLYFRAMIDDRFASDLISSSNSADTLEQFLTSYGIVMENEDKTEFKTNVLAQHEISGAKVLEVCNAIFVTKKWELFQRLGIPGFTWPGATYDGVPLPSPWGDGS